MAATATASSSGPRYAPDDPTLPKPWRGLVDGKTGYLYFWNPETNVTQYERPAASSRGGSHMPQKPSSTPLSSSVHVQQSSQGQRRDNSDDDDRYGRGSNGVQKLSSAGSNNQSARGGSDYSSSVSNGAIGAGHGGSSTRGYGSSVLGSGSSAVSYRHRHEITVSGEDVPLPFTSFEATDFPSEILREVQNAGFSAPTPIQAQSWPIVIQGRDIVAIAKTGSGKTLGYLMPGFLHLKRRRNNPQMGPSVLVLSPTRELATQIQEEAVKFGKSSKISCTCLYGGAPKGPQLRELDRGVDIIVATPGRLNDILEMKRVSLHQVSYLVLDEADRMLDMGFEPQIRKIVKEVPTRRQTLMFTATWPKEVRKIAADLLANPVQVNIGNVDELVANKAITQYVEVLPPLEKHRRLEQILRSQEPGSKIIIFCSTKKMCDQLARNLSRQFGASAIHGDKSQGERDHVLSQFRTGRSPVLVATDVAARGLDIKDIRVVVNYDFPTGIEDYVHRIGRTGRAGATGVAHTFFGDQDAKHASDLIKILEGSNQRVPNEIRDLASRGGGGGMSRFRRPFGSGSGGRDGGGRGGAYDSSYGGARDGGRGGWGFPSSSERGGGRGSDRESRDSDRYSDAPASSRVSFHASMTRAGDKDGARNRSRSPNKGSGWADSKTRARSRSRSPDRFDRAPPARERSPVRSFHKLMMERGRSPPKPQNQHGSSYNSSSGNQPSHPRGRAQSPSDGGERENFKESYDDTPKEWGKPPAENGFADGPPRSSYVGEEELEEGMIPADEEGMIPQEEDGIFTAAD